MRAGWAVTAARAHGPLARPANPVIHHMNTGAKQNASRRSGSPGLGRWRLFGAQIDRGFAAGLAVALQFEADLLAFGKAA